MPVTVRNMVLGAMRACGEDCTYSEADAWLTKTYGRDHGVTNNRFYDVRSSSRKIQEGLNGTVTSENPRPTKVTMVLNALRSCGENCDFKTADAWLTKTYGTDHGIASNKFFSIRCEFRKNREEGLRLGELVDKEVTPTEVKSPTVAVESPQVADSKEVTVEELRKMARLVREFGDVERVKRVIDCLTELLV